MKVGDLVKHAFGHGDESMVGVLLDKGHDPLSSNYSVFSVLWHNGEIWNNVWDYDLEVISGEVQS